jgi:hypothetical protein
MAVWTESAVLLVDFVDRTGLFVLLLSPTVSSMTLSSCVNDGPLRSLDFGGGFGGGCLLSAFPRTWEMPCGRFAAVLATLNHNGEESA